MRITPRTRARSARWWPVFAVAAVARGLYWALVTPHWQPRSDAVQYWGLGYALSNGDGFSMVFPQLEMHATAFRPPLYPVLLVPGSFLFDQALWPHRLLNLLIGSAVAVLAGVLAARIGGRRAGVVAGLVVALYPPLIANDTVTLTEPLALLLLLAAMLAADERRWALAGASCGLLLLTRPNGYLVVAVLAAWVWRQAGWRRALGLAGVALLVVFPWLVRNQVQVGTWRLTTSDGFTIAAVYNTPAQEAGNFVDPVFSPAYSDLDHRFAQFDEVEWNDKLTSESIEALKGNKRYVGTVLVRNAKGYFELDPSLNRYPERVDGRRWGFRQAMLPLFFAVTAAGLVGLAQRWRDPRVVVLALLTAQFVALSLLLVAPPRLRAPFDLAMCIGVGLLVAWVLDRRRSHGGAPTDAERPFEPVGVGP